MQSADLVVFALNVLYPFLPPTLLYKLNGWIHIDRLTHEISCGIKLEDVLSKNVQ